MPLVKPVVIKIENVVACAVLKHGIDLNAMVKAFPVVDYRRARYFVNREIRDQIRCRFMKKLKEKADVANKTRAHVSFVFRVLHQSTFIFLHLLT